MQARVSKVLHLAPFPLFLAVILALSLVVTFRPAYAASHRPLVVTLTHSSSQTGETTDWANVRSGTNTSSTIINTYAPQTTVTIYASVAGEDVWDGITTWYRVSSLNDSPLYIYSALVTLTSADNGNGGGDGNAVGKVIVVSLSRQWMYAYNNGTLVFNAAVMSGRPALPTPTGTYHVFQKLHPTTFYSPWPQGSPYYYPPTYINYALEWHEGGYFLHDSWWHSVYGPGTNGWHYDPQFGWQWGSHGCVAMPLSAAAWLYNWAPIGTTVQINP